jgi:hypothetical protein
MFRTRFRQQIVAEFLPPSQERKAQKVVVLCDGMPSIPRYQPLSEFLAAKGFWVIYPRYRGAWESDELLQPEVVDFAIESFGRQLRSSLASVSNELTEMRARKEKLEREIRNFTHAIAENGHSKYILEETVVREKEISGITDRLLSSTPDSIQSQIEEVRRLVEDGIQNLHQLFSEESPAAKEELHKHLSAVRMFPMEDGGGLVLRR